LARGTALDLKLTTETYPTALYGEVNLVDGVATHDE
jgi:alpha-N-arabinofuranosidase